MDFFNDIFHNLALLEFYFLNIIYILLYIDFILSIFFQHSNILTRASHHWCLASNIVLVDQWFRHSYFIDKISFETCFSDVYKEVETIHFSHTNKSSTYIIYPNRSWFKGLRPVLEGFVVPMHEGACETGSEIPRALARGIWRTVRTSPSALGQQTRTDRS